VRAPSGQMYFVAASIAGGHYSWVTTQRFRPATQELNTYDLIPQPGPNLGYTLPRAVACDANGNVIIAGWHPDYALNFYRSGRCFTIKMDPQMNVIWSAVHGPMDNGAGTGLNIASAVAVDGDNNVIMTSNVGTVKYAPDGRVLWESSEWGYSLSLDRFGNALLTKPVGRDDGLYQSEITKLNADGTLRWRIHFSHKEFLDNWPSGLVCGDAGDVYFAASSYGGSVIVKFVEHGQRDAFKEER
jgi:hypothetical protein